MSPTSEGPLTIHVDKEILNTPGTAGEIKRWIARVDSPAIGSRPIVKYDESGELPIYVGTPDEAVALIFSAAKEGFLFAISAYVEADPVRAATPPPPFSTSNWGRNTT